MLLASLQRCRPNYRSHKAPLVKAASSCSIEPVNCSSPRVTTLFLHMPKRRGSSVSHIKREAMIYFGYSFRAAAIFDSIAATLSTIRSGGPLFIFQVVTYDTGDPALAYSFCFIDLISFSSISISCVFIKTCLISLIIPCTQPSASAAHSSGVRLICRERGADSPGTQPAQIL
jgi:hypothetical protein